MSAPQSLSQPNLQHFPDTASALSYCVNELIDTLRDDLSENENDPNEESTCNELVDKIHDIEEVEHLVAAIPEVVDIVNKALAHDARLNAAEIAPTGDDYNTLMELFLDMKRSLEPIDALNMSPRFG